MNFNFKYWRVIREFSPVDGHTLLAIQATDKDKAWCCCEYCLFIYLLEKGFIILILCRLDFATSGFTRPTEFHTLNRLCCDQ